MLEHTEAAPVAPSRVVILGAAGFVGAALVARLDLAGVSTLALGRQELDLLAGDAADRLAGLLSSTDSLVFVSARAPVRNPSMLGDNIRMAEAVCAALEKVKPAHLVYVSSDAVYADSPDALTEASCAEPGSLHGVMHLARELMLDAVYDGPFAAIRPTLIYGMADPHNGYGPNRYRRQALAGEEIKLFGEGEERRDHVLVDDVADLIRRMLFSKSKGRLNAATGEVVSFRDLAELTVATVGGPSRVVGSPREGPMPHNGYRPFDPAATRAAFPDFRYTAVRDGVAAICRAAMAEAGG